MRGRLFGILAGFVNMAAVLAACSASEGGRSDRPGSGGSNTGSGGIVIGGGGGSGGSLGGLGGSGGSTPLPPHTACDDAMPCGAMQICVVGVGEPNHCAPEGGPCTMDSECGGDSYCCAEGCRTDGGPGLCIPYGYGPRGNVNGDCKGAGEAPGVFAPSVQCEWLIQPSDPSPDSKFVLTTPLVGDLPNDSGASAEIVIVTMDSNTADGASTSAPGVLRILSGQTCGLAETVADSVGIVRANATPAIGDLNGDNTMEIVARRDAGGVVAFNWDGGRYVKLWETPNGAATAGHQYWDAIALHDLDNDGAPEVLAGTAVYNGQSGAMINDGTSATGVINIPFNGLVAVAGDFDADGTTVELAGMVANEISYLQWQAGGWVELGRDGNFQRFGTTASHFAVADFGTPGAAAADFDFTALDGIAEMVAVDDVTGRVTVHALNHHRVLDIAAADRGGPPTIGDFDDDGFPEIAIAGMTKIQIYDPGCKGGGAGCAGDGILWSHPIQDASSAQTAVGAFDFDGDNRDEVVYADECFLRVFQGDNGEVLFSAFRTSGTWYEGPVIADVDKDDNTEIVVNSAYAVRCPTTSNPGTAYVDPLHKGARCDNNEGCVPGGNCVEGFCRCAGPADCDAGMSCTAPLGGTPGSGNVCRATHPNTPEAVGGIKVLRDRLDRWASSRPLWNQHAYSITNVNENGTIPKTSDWLRNWAQPGLNNFRQNVQGLAGFADYPDITGALSEDKVCKINGTQVTLTATVCNRGKKGVGADMPATFYQGDPSANQILCVSYTQGPVPVGGCLDVSCTVDAMSVSGEITMVVNDNGGGGQTTVECNSDNNRDTVTVATCLF